MSPVASRPRRALGALPFALLAIVLGVFAGLGAYVFRVLIAVIHDALLLGRFSASYDAAVHSPPSPWGPAVVLVPALAAIAVVFVVERWAPEARGHGVPEVMDAIHYRGGAIRPVVAVVKSIASALSIGSGGSVGREGPIVQIGASLASWIGATLRVSRWQVITLVAAGGGAGIAATFNTPIGGVLFAVEILMLEVSIRTLVPVALATATATFVGRMFFGNHPAFTIPPVHMTPTAGLALLPAYAGLGCIVAVAAAGFIRGLYGTEDLLEARLRNPYVRHALGMLGVGILMVGFEWGFGHYYVSGVGYATVADVLDWRVGGVGTLLVLFGGKLAATSLTLGSGASGGIFSPSLAMGATLGGAYAIALDALVPGLHLDPTALALAGMAAMVAGATGAALTAIVMIFEMTLDYSVVLPMTIAVAVAHGLRQRLVSGTIYTQKLIRRGHAVPAALHADTFLTTQVGQVPLSPAALLPADAPAARLDEVRARYVALHDGDHIVGLVDRERPAASATSARARDHANRSFVVVSPETPLLAALVALRAEPDAAHAIVARSGSVAGVATRAQLADALADRIAALVE